jgi:hypothetical protein
MTTENTALTVKARAAVALGSSKAEVELIELAGKSKSIVAITNKDGRAECHQAAMTAKEARINVEKAGKSAREDATAFSKAVISEEARLVALIKPEETRLIELRDGWDAKVKAEKEAAEEIERQRVAAIKARIAEFGLMVSDAAMLEAHGAEQELVVALAVEVDDSFAEFYGDAVEAKVSAVAKLREIVAAKTAAEALAAKVKAEQEAEAVRLAAERERMAAERAELDRQQAEQRAAEEKRQAEERARLDVERAELDRQRREIEAAQAEQRRIAEAEQAERNRVAAEEIRKLDAARKEAEKLAAANHIEQPLVMVESVVKESLITDQTIKLGEICQRLGFTVNAEFLAGLGIHPSATDKNAKLYPASKFPTICRLISEHVMALAFKKAA